ncbi:MAG TPA: type II secretion system protein [bacterium]|nr:type II secretion system protein [bacterium]
MKTLKKGFTLVELLVVVAIIGILAVVVLMNIQNAQKRARRNTVLTSLNDALRAAQACLADSGTLTTVTAATLSSTAYSGDTRVCTGSPTIEMSWPKLTDYNYGSTSPVTTGGAIQNFSITKPASWDATLGISCAKAADTYQCE